MAAPGTSLRLSIRVYRRLLRMYPAAFLEQFGEPMAQAFGDLAWHAFRRQGGAGLLILWVRIVPDLARSAAREYLSAAIRLGPSDRRARWIVACTCGAGLGVLVGAPIARLGLPSVAGSIGLTLGLGLLQSVWALRRTGWDAARWIVATVAGVFVLAMPFRLAVGVIWGLSELVALLLAGAGVGLLQCLALRAQTVGAWHWAAANAFGFLGGRIVSVAMLQAAGPSVAVTLLTPWAGGLTFGCLTAIALGSVLGPAEHADERALPS